MAAAKISFNGRFLTASPTGVQRVAEQLIVAFDQLLQSDQKLASAIEASLLVPRNADRLLPKISFDQKQSRFLSGRLWEQLELPFSSNKSLLISLCNQAPIWSKSGITMIHDAQVFLTPSSYSSPFRVWYQRSLPMIGANSKKILTVSNYSKGQLSDWGIAPPEKVAVIYNGVEHILAEEADDSIVSRLGLTPKQFAVGLSNVQAHKNLKTVIDAYSRPALQSSTLVLFGGASREDFEQAGVDVPQNVVFAGFVTQAELRSLLSNAHAMVFPSLTEGFGLPPLEAMVLGTPAICAPCGALPEVCGDAAAYADPSEPEAWEAELLRLNARSDEERSNQSARCIAHAQGFTWDIAARRLCDEILQCL